MNFRTLVTLSSLVAALAAPAVANANPRDGHPDAQFVTPARLPRPVREVEAARRDPVPVQRHHERQIEQQTLRPTILPVQFPVFQPRQARGEHGRNEHELRRAEEMRRFQQHRQDGRDGRDGRFDGR